jgi:hypothetical protein
MMSLTVTPILKVTPSPVINPPVHLLLVRVGNLRIKPSDNIYLANLLERVHLEKLNWERIF